MPIESWMSLGIHIHNNISWALQHCSILLNNWSSWVQKKENNYISLMKHWCVKCVLTLSISKGVLDSSTQLHIVIGAITSLVFSSSSYRWWHVTGTWPHVLVGAQTACSCGMSCDKREKRPKSWPRPSVIIWPHISETRACLRSSVRRWSSYGWPSPPAWSSSMLTCAKFSMWLTSSPWPTVTPWCKRAYKVTIAP